MTVETETLMMEILRKIQTDVATVKTDLREIKTRVGQVELRLAQFEVHLGNIEVRMAESQIRADRRDQVIERILSRLDLSETPNPSM